MLRRVEKTSQAVAGSTIHFGLRAVSRPLADLDTAASKPADPSAAGRQGTLLAGRADKPVV